MLSKETLRPLTLVMMYFMFFVMSGLSPIRPNMVNVCGAFGMTGDPKNIVVSLSRDFVMICNFFLWLPELFELRMSSAQLCHVVGPREKKIYILIKR